MRLAVFQTRPSPQVSEEAVEVVLDPGLAQDEGQALALSRRGGAGLRARRSQVMHFSSFGR